MMTSSREATNTAPSLAIPVASIAGKAVFMMPVKGYSARLPDKNLFELHGKPMFIYGLEQIEMSAHFGKGVYVITESDRVRDLLRTWKGIAPDSAFGILYENRSEQKSVVDSVARALRSLAAAGAIDHGDVVCVVYANCPSRDLRTIDACIEAVIGPGPGTGAIGCSTVRTYNGQGKETGNVWAFRFDTDMLEDDFTGWYTYTGMIVDEALEIHTPEDLDEVDDVLRAREFARIAMETGKPVIS